MKLDPNKAALTLGVFVGGLHLVWSALVALSLAQPFVDFIFSMHMMANPYQVTGFNVATAGMLVVITFVVGYGVGYVFANVWNKVHK